MMPSAALGGSNPIMPEEALAEKEHLRTGASANGAAPEGPPAGVPPVQR